MDFRNNLEAEQTGFASVFDVAGGGLGEARMITGFPLGS